MSLLKFAFFGGFAFVSVWTGYLIKKKNKNIRDWPIFGRVYEVTMPIFGIRSENNNERKAGSVKESENNPEGGMGKITGESEDEGFDNGKTAEDLKKVSGFINDEGIEPASEGSINDETENIEKDRQPELTLELVYNPESVAPDNVGFSSMTQSSDSCDDVIETEAMQAKESEVTTLEQVKEGENQLEENREQLEVVAQPVINVEPFGIHPKEAEYNPEESEVRSEKSEVKSKESEFFPKEFEVHREEFKIHPEQSEVYPIKSSANELQEKVEGFAEQPSIRSERSEYHSKDSEIKADESKINEEESETEAELSETKMEKSTSIAEENIEHSEESVKNNLISFQIELKCENSSELPGIDRRTNDIPNHNEVFEKKEQIMKWESLDKPAAESELVQKESREQFPDIAKPESDQTKVIKNSSPVTETEVSFEPGRKKSSERNEKHQMTSIDGKEIEADFSVEADIKMPLKSSPNNDECFEELESDQSDSSDSSKFTIVDMTDDDVETGNAPDADFTENNENMMLGQPITSQTVETNARSISDQEPLDIATDAGLEPPTQNTTKIIAKGFEFQDDQNKARSTVINDNDDKTGVVTDVIVETMNEICKSVDEMAKFESSPTPPENNSSHSNHSHDKSPEEDIKEEALPEDNLKDNDEDLHESNVLSSLEAESPKQKATNKVPVG